MVAPRLISYMESSEIVSYSRELVDCIVHGLRCRGSERKKEKTMQSNVSAYEVKSEHNIIVCHHVDVFPHLLEQTVPKQKNRTGFRKGSHTCPLLKSRVREHY